jgi:hypothetical protein
MFSSMPHSLDNPNPAIATEGRGRIRGRGRGRTSSVDHDYGDGNTPRRWSRLGAQLAHGKPCYSKGLSCFASLAAEFGDNPSKTSQPPWKSSTRAAGIPRRCWLSSCIYVKRLTLRVERVGTPAFAGAWEDKQHLELKPCCLPPLAAIPVPDSFGMVSNELSYRYFRDFMKIPEPQPRPFDLSPMTNLSGLTGLGRRNL